MVGISTPDTRNRYHSVQDKGEQLTTGRQRHLDDDVVRTGHDIDRIHFGKLCQALGRGLELSHIRLNGNDHAAHEAQVLRIRYGHNADCAALQQSLHAPSYGGLSQTQLAGDLNVRCSPVLLQNGNDLPVPLIQSVAHGHPPCIVNYRTD